MEYGIFHSLEYNGERRLVVFCPTSCRGGERGKTEDLEDRGNVPAIPPNLIPTPDVLNEQQDGAGTRELCAVSANRGRGNLAMAKRLLAQDVLVSELTKMSLSGRRCGKNRCAGHMRMPSKG